MEKNAHCDADKHLLHAALETIQIFYGDKAFKIKKDFDKKKLFNKFIGTWQTEAIGELDQPFNTHLKVANINQEWFLNKLKNTKSKQKTITGRELVTLIWDKYNQN